MREILFRGKLHDGRWSEGNLCVSKDGVCIITPDATPVGCYGRVDPDTVGQYTGLTDSNGKKIFEGDILRFAETEEYNMWREAQEYPEDYEGMNPDAWVDVAVVKWQGENDYPAFDLSPSEFEANGLSWIKCDDFVFEVIGNIHDNPELLKGGAKA